MEPPALSAEELLQHAGWLRGLARRLVGEAHADDVLQETWKTALERPPRSRVALPAWLAQVARNAARQIRRSETARHKREARTAKPEIDVSAAAVAERADLHRQLVDEVMSLEEPYRRVLLLRWFEEREPKEIAALLGTSAGTVRSQLKRGLERLRERLDRRFGDRKTWIGAFVPLAFGRPATIATTGGGALAGGLLMSLKSKFALPLFALLILGGVLATVIAVTAMDSDPTTERAGITQPGENPTAKQDESPRRPVVLFGRAPAERSGPGGITARVARIDSGDAVAGARILLSGLSLDDDEIARRTTTDASGRFDLADLPAGDAYVLSVEGEKLPPLDLRAITVSVGRTDDLGTLWLGKPGALEGRVLDPTGHPAAGARVRVHMSAGAPWDFMAQIHEVFGALDREPTPEAVATTDRDGRFQFKSLPPGIVSVSASAPGHQAAHATFAVVPDAPTAALTLRLTTGREITGTVMDETGAPLSGARVAAVPGQLDLDAVMYGRRFASTDARGRFSISGVGRDEDLMLIAAYAGRPAVMTEIEPDDKDVTLVVRGGTTLDVRILASDGATPVADAQVILIVGPTENMEGRESQSFLVGRTDSAGSILFEVWPGYIQMALLSHPDHAPGMWVGLMAAMGAPGGAKGPESSKLELGRHRVEFTLPAGRQVSGRILDPHGHAIAGARVRAVRFGMPDTISVRSDEFGHYRIVMPFGSQLHAAAPGYAQSPDSSLVITNADADGITEHDVAMIEAAVVTGRVLLPDGSPAAGALVRLRNADAQRSNFSVSTDRQVFARADGRFLMDSIAPGHQWHALARLPGFVDGMAGPFEVGSVGRTTSPDVRLVAGASLEITVQDESGRAVSGVSVSIGDRRPVRLEWNPMDLEDPSRPTDAKGVARLGPVAPGTRELHATRDGFVPVSKSIVVAPDARGLQQESLTLTRGRVIKGRVLDADDAPIDGAVILAVSGTDDIHRVETSTIADGSFEASGLSPTKVVLEVRAEGFRLTRLHLPEGEDQVDVRLTRVDPAAAARRKELEAQRKALFTRLMEAQDEDEKAAVLEDLRRVGSEIKALNAE